MRKKTLILFSIIFSIFMMNITAVKADTAYVSFEDDDNRTFYTDRIDNGLNLKYKYVRIVWTSDSSRKLTVSLMKYSTEESNDGKVVGTSASRNISSGDIWYILPRSGASCPSDATYCFGVDSGYNGTVIDTNYAFYGLKISADSLFFGVTVEGKFALGSDK